MDKTTDIYFKKTLDFKYYGQSLKFRVSQDLFSSHQIDVGTLLLLKTLGQADLDSCQKILDLGCGYGPLGLALKSVNKKRVVHMVDRDALAVTYSKQNAKLNKISDVHVYGSIGYDDVTETDFHLIASNIPGKAGEQVIGHFLQDASRYLVTDGIVAVVVVNPLQPLVRGILQEIQAHILLQEIRSEYTVFHYQFAEAPTPSVCKKNSIERRLYHRDRMTVSLKNMKFFIDTARGLKEFDTLSYETELLINKLQKLKSKPRQRVIAVNPGQGHIPVSLWLLLKPEEIVLVGRDLLSLKYAKHNLLANGCPSDRIQIKHQLGIQINDGIKSDLVVGVLENEGQEAISWIIEQASQELTEKGGILVASGSTVITRLQTMIQDHKHLMVADRKRRKGKSFLAITLK